MDNQGINISPMGLVSRKDAAKALLMKPKTLAEWAAVNKGPPPKKIGGRIFYKWEDVQSFAHAGSKV